MNFELTEPNQTMSSLEIAKLTGKEHKNVLRDIRNMLKELKIDTAQFSAVYKSDNGQQYDCFNLPKRECDILVSGYEVKYRAAIVDRWHELEANEPIELMSYDMIAQLATQMGNSQRALMAVEAQNNRLNARAKNIENVIDIEVQRINTDINQLQIDSQNGVPLGYMSKKNAYLLYGLDFAPKAFEKLMAGMPVKTKKYVHTEAGHSSRSVAYHTNDVIIAVKNVKSNIIQLSAHRATCTLVPNSNFRYK